MGRTRVSRTGAAPKAAIRSHREPAMTEAFHMLIDGKLVDGPTTFDVVNPATGQAFAKCPKADSALLNKAVAAAKAAFPAWSKRPIDERAGMVQKISELLEA